MKRSLSALIALTIAVFAWPDSADPVQRVGVEGGIESRIDSLEAGISASDVRVLSGGLHSPAGGADPVGGLGFYDRTENAAIAWDVTAADTLYDATENAHLPFIPSGAHVCFVADTSLAPVADTLQLIGATVDGSGTVTDPDTVLVTFAAADSINTFKQTTEYWIGEVIINRISAADSARSTNIFTVRAFDNDLIGDGPVDFTVRALHVYGLTNGTDASTRVWLMHHTADGWTFNAAGLTLPTHFPTVICSMDDDYGVYDRAYIQENWTYWRNDLSQAINADNGVDGIVLMIDGQTNESFEGSYTIAIQ